MNADGTISQDLFSSEKIVQMKNLNSISIYLKNGLQRSLKRIGFAEEMP